MKQLLQKIFRQKKLGIAIILLLVVFILLLSYTLIGVRQNVVKMQVLGETPEYFPDYPAVNMEGKDPAVLQRGENLVKAGDCIACHTNTLDKGKAYAGGLPMPTPFGTIYAPNITPDKETGIGNWTEEQFIKAMREGISPTGHYYYPAFPYLYFTKITLDDLKAIKAYLDSIPAVKQPNRENEMVFPFNWRFLQLGWRIIFFHPENKDPFTPNPEHSAARNRGAYLVEGLGHCAMCHSPSYNLFTETLPLGAPIRKYDLTGAKIQGYLAPNITESNLGKASIEEIIEVFTKDKMVGGGKIEGPMVEVNHNSLSRLGRDDLVAIATYLKETQSESPPLPKAGAGGFGKALYDTYCSGCHAMGSGGAPKLGDPTTWDPLIKDGMERVYTNAIKGIGSMPAKGTCMTCSDQQIKEAVDYMVASTKGGAATAPAVPKLKQLTMEDGKRIYEKQCSACHNTGVDNAPKLGDKKAFESSVNAGFLETFHHVVTGKKGHPKRGGCQECTDGELKAAVKYMMQEGSVDKDYSLW